MKNKLNIWLILLLLLVINFKANSEEQFSFNIKEIEIVNNGDKIIGKNKGVVTSSSGVKVKADEFEYNKKTNLLNAFGNVEVHDKINNYLIYAEEINYDKNNEIIKSKKKSKAISVNDDVVIDADEFEYLRIPNIISAYKDANVLDNKKKNKLSSDYIRYFVESGKMFAEGNSNLLNLKDSTSIDAENFEYDIIKNIIIANKNVVLENKEKKYKIFSNEIKYLKNMQKFITTGNTSAELKSKYKIVSSNLIFLEDSMEIFSKNNTIIKDKNNAYNTSDFRYYIDKEFLKANNIIITSNFQKPQNDKYYFSNAMIDLKNQNFVAEETKIDFRKNIFNDLDNDPRIKGVSSKKNGDITLVNKGVFTSCKKNDNCPPWAIQANEIKHDKDKKEMIYKDAILKVYNVPVLYFPKFFHPDPTVKRRSGILQPALNDSNILGSSLTIPYYHVLSEQSDLTLAPSIFDTDTKMIQTEYRKITENTNILLNFGHERDYKSISQNKKKNTNYIFSEIDLNLDLNNFNTSKIDFNFEKVTNDDFLKIFDTNLIDDVTSLKPKDDNIMKSEFSLTLDHEKYNFITGFSSYENLQKTNNDRYEYVLPYYTFNKSLITDLIDGSINFSSSGSNVLNNTNQLLTKNTNTLSFSSLDFFTGKGFKNNYNINLKNLNSVGENVSGYKSSPRSELSSLFEINSYFPLKKLTSSKASYITPKISFRVNPGDMKNHRNSDATINTDNIFSVDRFGLNDSFEAGKSVTVGIDYRNENLNEMNKYFEMKLATVYRDKEEIFIPSESTLDKKSSNIFGSMSTNIVNNLNLDYNFSLDNNFDEIEYNDISATISLNNFSSKFNFLKETNEFGDESFIKNSTTYEFGNNNSLSFNTRRNRKINLTEFYDLVYEYKNDCLVAGLKYKKSYYEDKDLKPTEDLLFTITFIPLTTYEQKIEQFN